ncbi:protein OSB2, chloroplastic-like [Senna tora]|uniref:Protein OSB2, chloroplastic-like n=1 Tax=Senna tora TaxID=362788 RepID=A0A834T2L8_9FABA|nr:protein OSB2, chloroplastic-like [Senna tora]
MNALRRALRVFAYSATSKERPLLHPTTFILQSYSTAGTRKRSKPLPNSSPPLQEVAVSERPRPSEIPFQPKVANSVNLIGQVHIPVQFHTSPDGKTWAATVISRLYDSYHLWIPVIFEGDLAHVAACHLKENDCIHIAGNLSADPPYLNENPGQCTFQVMVHTLNFVEGYPVMKNISTVSKKEGTKIISAVSKFIFTVTIKDKSVSLLSSWKDLLDDPKQWWDCRDSKNKGLVKPKYPDFKRKDGSIALWLNQAPNWALSELKGLEVDVLAVKSKQANEKNGDDIWRDVVENPNKWWDNRSNKRNGRAPDFKHKETGEALWLNRSPSWVLTKLPPLKPKQVETN